MNVFNWFFFLFVQPNKKLNTNISKHNNWITSQVIINQLTNKKNDGSAPFKNELVTIHDMILLFKKKDLLTKLERTDISVEEKIRLIQEQGEPQVTGFHMKSGGLMDQWYAES